VRGVGLTRGRLLRATVGVGAAVAAFPRLAFGKDTGIPHAVGLAVRGATKPFAGDRPMFVTIAPGSQGRDTATVLFALGRRASVRLEAVRTGIGTTSVRWSTQETLDAGAHRLAWRPAADIPVG